MDARSRRAWTWRRDPTVVEYVGRLWLMGGCTLDVKYWYKLSDVWCSSPDGEVWTRVGSAPWEPRSDHASVVWRERIWVLALRIKSRRDDRIAAEPKRIAPLRPLRLCVLGVKSSRLSDFRFQKIRKSSSRKGRREAEVRKGKRKADCFASHSAPGTQHFLSQLR